jgi:hypothetical protein
MKIARMRQRRRRQVSTSKLKRRERQMKKLGKMRLWEWFLLIGAILIAMIYVILVLPRMFK